MAKMDTVKTTPVFLKTDVSLSQSTFTQSLLASQTWNDEEAEKIHTVINMSVSSYLDNQALESKDQSPEIQQAKMATHLFQQLSNSQDETIKQAFEKITEQQTTALVQERTQEIFRDWTKYVIEIPRVSFYRPDPQPHFDTSYRVHTGFLQ